jgi:hypothetical protein
MLFQALEFFFITVTFLTSLNQRSNYIVNVQIPSILCNRLTTLGTDKSVYSIEKQSITKLK